MADKAREITADSLGERLPVGNPQDEFGRLASVFNDTLSRLHDAFDRLRRFTSDASHELRTPLTAMRSVGEIALQSPLEPKAYRDVIGSMLEEVDRLTRLVDSLLMLTRADSAATPPAREVVDLGCAGRQRRGTPARACRGKAAELERAQRRVAEGPVRPRHSPTRLHESPA